MARTRAIAEQGILGLVASDFSYKEIDAIAVGVDTLKSFPDSAERDEYGFAMPLVNGLGNSATSPSRNVVASAGGPTVIDFTNWIVDEKFNDYGDGFGAVVF